MSVTICGCGDEQANVQIGGDLWTVATLNRSFVMCDYRGIMINKAASCGSGPTIRNIRKQASSGSK